MRLRSCLMTVSMSFCRSRSVFLNWAKTLFFLLVSFILEVEAKVENEDWKRKEKDARLISHSQCSDAVSSSANGQYGHTQSPVREEKRCFAFKVWCVCVCAQCHMRRCVCFVAEHWTVLDLQEFRGPQQTRRDETPRQGASSRAQNGPPGTARGAPSLEHPERKCWPWSRKVNRTVLNNRRDHMTQRVCVRTSPGGNPTNSDSNFFLCECVGCLCGRSTAMTINITSSFNHANAWSDITHTHTHACLLYMYLYTHALVVVQQFSHTTQDKYSRLK